MMRSLRSGCNKTGDLLNLVARRVFSTAKIHFENPPSYFQDVNNQPLPYRLHHNNTLKLNSHPNIFSNSSKNNNINDNNNYSNDLPTRTNIGVIDLLRMKHTRKAAFCLLFGITFLNSLVFSYLFIEAAEEANTVESDLLELWDSYERKDISQTVMAVHIGMLKNQLIQADISPVSSDSAMALSIHMLSFQRDKKIGQLLIFVDQKSPLYPLIPFHSEYDISRIPKFNNLDFDQDDGDSESDEESDSEDANRIK